MIFDFLLFISRPQSDRPVQYIYCIYITLRAVHAGTRLRPTGTLSVFRRMDGGCGGVMSPQRDELSS